MEVKSHINLLKEYFKFNIKCNLEYRVNFYIQFITIIIQNISLLFFWYVIYSKVSSVGGYSFNQGLILLAMVRSTAGICFIIFGNIGELCDIIVKGKLDKYLLQPKEVIINICGSKMDISGWGDLSCGYILLFIAKGLDIVSIFKFTIFTIIGSIIFLSTLVIINSLTFYLKNVENTKRFLESMLTTFSSYPEGIYNKFFKYVFYTFIPIGFIVYIPVNLLDKFNIIVFIILIFATFIYSFIAYKVFYIGVKKYESGNLIQNII